MANSIPQYKPKEDAPKRDTIRPSVSPSVKKDRPLKYTDKQLREALENAFGMVALAFSAGGDMHCATIVVEQSAEVIDSWMWLASKHPGVRRTFELLCGGGGYLALITSTLGLALPIMQHHGYYPENLPTPASLKSVVSKFGNSKVPDVPDYATSDRA